MNSTGPPNSARAEWVKAIAALVLGFVAGVAVWRQLQPKAPVSSAARVPVIQGLKLKVQRDGGTLRLSWDRNAEAVRRAGHATLYIEDGAHHSHMDLDPAKLTAGIVSYWPENPVVEFRLDITTPNGTTSEAIRVLGNTNVPAAATDAAPKDSSKPSPWPLSPVTGLRRPREAPTVHDGMPRDKVTEDEPSAFISGPVPPRPAPAPEPSQPPANRTLAQRAPAADLRTAPSRPRETELPSAEPPSYVSVSAEPVQSTFFGRVVHKIPLIRRLKRQPADFMPPQAVHQIPPTLSRAERDSLTKETAVLVRVHVTETGKVDYAEPVSHLSERNRPLAAAAVYAARRWSFTPARLGEENVPGEMVLHFEFRPPEVTNE